MRMLIDLWLTKENARLSWLCLCLCKHTFHRIITCFIGIILRQNWSCYSGEEIMESPLLESVQQTNELCTKAADS